DRRVADLGAAPHPLPVAGDVGLDRLVDQPDGGGVDQQFGPPQGGDPGGLGVPLVVADQRRYPAGGRVEYADAGVAGLEAALLVVEDVLGAVRLAVGAGQRPVGGEHRASVEERPLGGLLEHRAADQGDVVLPGRRTQRLGGGAGDRLGALEGGAVV